MIQLRDDESGDSLIDCTSSLSLSLSSNSIEKNWFIWKLFCRRCCFKILNSCWKILDCFVSTLTRLIGDDFWVIETGYLNNLIQFKRIWKEEFQDEEAWIWRFEFGELKKDYWKAYWFLFLFLSFFSLFVLVSLSTRSIWLLNWCFATISQFARSFVHTHLLLAELWRKWIKQCARLATTICRIHFHCWWLLVARTPLSGRSVVQHDSYGKS